MEECFREVGSRKMPLLCNAQLWMVPMLAELGTIQQAVFLCVLSCVPCVQQGTEMRMRQFLTPLSSLFLPATILASCRRHHSSIQAVSAREKKVVLPFAHQRLSVVPLLSPAQRGVVAQTMGRGRNTQVFLHLSLPIKKQDNSSFYQRNARVGFRHVSKVLCLCQHKKGIWLEQVKLFVVSHDAHTLKVQMFPPCSKG